MTSFEQALIKESICNAQLYIHILQHLSDKTNHNDSFRKRPRYFKDVSYLAGGFERTWKDRLPYIKTTRSIQLMWRGPVVKVLEEDRKKKTLHPALPPPLNYIQKVEQWIKRGSFIQNVQLNLRTVFRTSHCHSKHNMKTNITLHSLKQIKMVWKKRKKPPVFTIA